MSLLTPSWLRVFLAVAEHGSFNKAAEALLLTQPAVSQKVRQLEALLGVKLFERTPHGARLTSEGHTLQRYAHAVHWLLLAAEDALAAGLHNAPLTRHLHLGNTPSLSAHCFPAWLKAFVARHPHIMVHLHTATTSEIVAAVARHTLHLGLIEGELPDEKAVAYTVLQESPFVLITPPTEPWTAHQTLPLSSLHQQPFIARPPQAQTRRWMENLFARHHTQPRIIAEIDQPDAIKKAVAHGVGVSLLPECMLTPEDAQRLHIITLADAPLKRYLKAIWPQDMPLHPAALAFLETLTPEFPHLREVIHHARHPDLKALYHLLEQGKA